MTPHIHVVALATSLAALASSSWAERITLNDTGMTQCVSKQKEWISECAKSGQDAAHGRDARNADPEDGNAGFSFRKVCRSGQMAGEGACPADPVMGSGPDHWGCTYDNVTQFTWEMKTTDGGLHDSLQRYTNKGGGSETDVSRLVEETNAEALCGLTDWRLPDPIELQSIVDYEGGAPDRLDACVDYAFFPNTRRAEYWTRTESFFDPNSMWYVAGCDRAASEKRFEPLYARLIHRNPSALNMQAASRERFVPSADGTEVTDTMTGLVWRRCVEGTVWSGDTQTCTGAVTYFHWRDALAYVRANREGGWRLPNIKELFSIVDFEARDPAIDRLAFPNSPSTGFLSSTPTHSVNVYYKIVSFLNGSVEEQEASRWNDWPLRMVRRGRK